MSSTPPPSGGDPTSPWQGPGPEGAPSPYPQPYGQQPSFPPGPGQPLGPPQPPPYGWTPWQQPGPPPPPSGNGLAIAAFVVGLVSLLGSWIPLLNVLAIISALVALVLGILAIQRTRRGAGGKGLAVAGTVIASAAILLAIVVNTVTLNVISSDDPTVATPSRARPTPTPVVTTSPAAPEVTPSTAPPPDATTTAAPEAILGSFPGMLDSDVLGMVGDTLTLNGVSVTVGQSTTATDYFGDYLVNPVTIINNSSQTVSFSRYDFSLQNPAGVIESATFMGSDNNLDMADLAPGGSVTGDVSFEVANPGEGGQYVILYQPSIFFDDRAAWIMQR